VQPNVWTGAAAVAPVSDAPVNPGAPLVDSLHFVVLWAVVVPPLGVGGLAAALWSIGRAIWLDRFAHARTKSSPNSGAQI
jgi:hypothetical protein